MSELTAAEVAGHAGVSPSTLRRWVKAGVIPAYSARRGWTPTASAQARIVARLRERDHSLRDISEAERAGRLAFGYLEDLFVPDEGGLTLEEAARDTGLEPALIRRIFTALGYPTRAIESISENDLRLLRHLATVLGSGFPLVAFLQLARVYGQALAQIADAEVKLFHLYVHEPLLRDGIGALELAEELQGMARDILPLASPVMDHVHRRFLRHFVEQDVFSRVEVDLDAGSVDLGRLRVAIAFADLAGYTRLIEEQGEEEAIDEVERFFEAVEVTLPDSARVVKTIGDEVMIVATDAAGLTDWAVGFQTFMTERPRPRLGMHYGRTLYRDGDYYGRDVNLASRVAARAAGGEVLVTRALLEEAGPHLEFEPIGEVRLKGFSEPTELFIARPAEEE